DGEDAAAHDDDPDASDAAMADADADATADGGGDDASTGNADASTDGGAGGDDDGDDDDPTVGSGGGSGSGDGDGKVVGVFGPAGGGSGAKVGPHRRHYHESAVAWRITAGNARVARTEQRGKRFDVWLGAGTTFEDVRVEWRDAAGRWHPH